MRMAWVVRPIAYLVGLSRLAYLVQGWVVGAEGFSRTHTILIPVAGIISIACMVWLAIIVWRMPDLVAARLADQGAGGTTTSPTITRR